MRRPPLRLSRCAAATVVVSVFAAATAPAVAAPPAVDYRADASCPEPARFRSLVTAALDLPGDHPLELDEARGPDQPSRVRVEIRAEGDAFRGTMERVQAGAVSAPRVVTGPRCDEVAQALALTVALSLAADEPATPAPLVATRAPASPAVAAMVLAAPPPTVVVPPVPRAPATPALGPPGASAAGGGEWRWHAALGASAGAWLSPDLLAGVTGAVALRAPSAVGSAALGWGARWRGGYARNDWRGDSPVAQFHLASAALELCAHARPARGPIELGLCAGPEAGWLHGRGVRITTPRATDSLWLAVGGGPALRVPLGGRWLIEAQGVVERPLRRVRFSFDEPAQTVAETRPWAWIGALSVIARLQ